MKILIITREGETFTLDNVDSSDKIQTVKEAIERKENIEQDLQVLMFNNERLDEQKTFAHYDLQEGSMLQLLIEYQLFIKNGIGEDIPITLDSLNITVKDLKKRIEEILPNVKATGMKCYFQGKELKDEKILSSFDYNTSTINLTYTFPGGQ